jgi:glycosyltransferase involved in cell wall biosynthesis
VCGDGALREPLAERLREQGVADAAELLGHVPVEDGLHRRYRESDLLLHVSWTEGVPQVLLEAFAARLPVVATDVGGVAAVTGGRAALLVPPGDPDAAARAVLRLAAEPELRAALVEAGLEIAREHTLQAECRRIAAFLRASWRPAGVPT